MSAFRLDQWVRYEVERLFIIKISNRAYFETKRQKSVFCNSRNSDQMFIKKSSVYGITRIDLHFMNMLLDISMAPDAGEGDPQNVYLGMSRAHTTCCDGQAA